MLLSAANNGSSLTLSWPRGATGFSLYSATSVTGPWTVVSSTPVVSADGATQSVTIIPSGGTQFYRLQKP